VQFATRYLFFGLGITYFNFVDGIAPAWSTVDVLNASFAVYFALNTLFFLHALRRPIAPTRYRLAMWVDIAITSISVLNDPYAIPPSLLVYIMIVLGNGMRYGMRLFGEALIASFAAVMLTLSLRFVATTYTITPGVLFLNLFGGIILVYSYILMGRIEASRRQLEQSSRADVLTGLLNRRALQETAEFLFNKLGRGDFRLALIFADLDKFKAINDTHGHAVGDQVLRAFAAIVRDSVRISDVTARLGGDEFVLILENTSLDAAQTVAHRIQTRVASWAADNALDFSVSIGLGEAPTHGTSFAEVLERVDKAMYDGKAESGCGGIRQVQASASAA
jgi:diguanylate cyclase (GGDEF)-like protein